MAFMREWRPLANTVKTTPEHCFGSFPKLSALMPQENDGVLASFAYG
jgi:hypothetical protein